jgi:hypothetical protein
MMKVSIESACSGALSGYLMTSLTISRMMSLALLKGAPGISFLSAQLRRFMKKGKLSMDVSFGGNGDGGLLVPGGPYG